MKPKSILSCVAVFSFGLLFVQPAHAVIGAPVEIALQTTSETAPNAVPIADAPDGLYGDTSTTSCTTSNDTKGDSCWNPLTIQFDVTSLSDNSSTAQAQGIASLSDPSDPSMNFLNLTNSIGSNDGSLTSVQASFGCDASSNLIGSIVVTNEDGSVFTFTVAGNQPDCGFTQPVSLTFGSTGGSSGGDNGAATLYVYPNSELTGSYYGTWDNSTIGGHPLSTSASGGSTINVSVDDDFTTTATATLPPSSLGSCQASDETFTSAEAISLGQGITSTIGGYSTGGDMITTVADTSGDVLWLVGTSTDAYGNILPANQLFFSAYVAVAGSGLSSCPGGIFWDAPFQKLHGNAKPQPPLKGHAHSKMPKRLRERLGSQVDASDHRDNH